MKIRFWGTRGSIAVPGPNTVRYGGNTSCVEVQAQDELVILDCGTGVRELGQALATRGSGPIEGHILLSHTHWDHIQGFPFFLPVLMPGNQFTIYSARGYDKPLKDVLSGQMDYTYFPIKLAQLQSPVTFRELDEETFDIGNVAVTTQFMNHTTLTMGYRLLAGGRTVVFATDTEPFGPYKRGEGNEDPSKSFTHEGDIRFIRFVSGADVLIHDAQYTEEEYPRRLGWGHSTIDYALEVALVAKVRHLVLFHHDVSRTDNQVAELEAYAKQRLAERGSDLIVTAAAEGMEIELQERDEERVAHAATLTHAVSKKSRILFADDDPEIIQLLTDAFADPNVYEVHVARDGESAIEKAVQLQPDLIVLDVFTPKVDGLTASRKLRSQPELRETPIILITAEGLEEYEAEGFEIGINDFMRKPFALSQLRTRVQMWLNRNAQPRSEASLSS